MACDFRIPAGMSAPQRKKQIEEAVDRLNKALAVGEVKLKIGPTGGVAFIGNWQRDGVSDVCAYRKLVAAGSPSLRTALARAEVLAERKVDLRAIAAGEHTHDGKSWHKGH